MSVTPSFTLDSTVAPLLSFALTDNVQILNYGFRHAVEIPFELQPKLGTVPIPYNIAAGSPTFQFNNGISSAREQYIIKAQDMGRFICAVLPAKGVFPTNLAGWPGTLNLNRRMPGNPLFQLQSVSVEGVDQEKCSDPYECDGARTDFGNNANDNVMFSWLRSYNHLLRVTLEYQYDPIRNRDLDPKDPRTFAKFDANISGEFLNFSQKNAHGIDVGSGGTFTSFAGLPEDFDASNDVAQWGQNTFAVGDASTPIGEFDLPLSSVIGTVEHSVTWPDVWEVPLHTITRLLGRVNNATLPWLNSAPPETVLFVGAALREQDDLSDNGRRLTTVELRFVEKRLFVEGAVEIEDDLSEVQLPSHMLTWNHFFRPANGRFEYIILGDKTTTDRRVYMPDNFERLWIRDVSAAPAGPNLEPNFTHNTERGIVPNRAHPCGYQNSQTPGVRP